MELDAAYPHPDGIGAREVAALLAPLVGVDLDNIAAYIVLVVDKDGMLFLTGTDNIPMNFTPEFLEWAARNVRETMREAN